MDGCSNRQALILETYQWGYFYQGRYYVSCTFALAANCHLPVILPGKERGSSWPRSAAWQTWMKLPGNGTL